MTESWRFPQILGMKVVAVTQTRVQYVLPNFACIYLQQPLLTTLITTPLQRLLMIHSMVLEFLYFSILLQKTLEQQEHLLIFHMQYPVQSRCQLPEAYTEVAPVIAPAKHPQVSATTVNIQPDRGVFNRSFKDELKWLENSSNVICNQERLKEDEVVSWGAFHSCDLSSSPSASAISALLPLFPDQAKSIAMIRHAMDIIKLSVNHLNPDQVPVIALDQPLFAVGKEILWNWSDLYGEKKFVVMFGGLHIEMAFLKVIGGWLQGSGWTTALADGTVRAEGMSSSAHCATKSDAQKFRRHHYRWGSSG